MYDKCDNGIPWDPTLSAYYYRYLTGPTKEEGIFEAYETNTPINWQHFHGAWGDFEYPKSDRRQKYFFGFKKFGGGPSGPWDKGLERKEVWPDGLKGMKLRDNLGPFA